MQAQSKTQNNNKNSALEHFLKSQGTQTKETKTKETKPEESQAEQFNLDYTLHL